MRSDLFHWVSYQRATHYGRQSVPPSLSTVYQAQRAWGNDEFSPVAAERMLAKLVTPSEFFTLEAVSEWSSRNGLLIWFCHAIGRKELPSAAELSWTKHAVQNAQSILAILRGKTLTIPAPPAPPVPAAPPAPYPGDDGSPSVLATRLSHRVHLIKYDQVMEAIHSNVWVFNRSNKEWVLNTTEIWKWSVDNGAIPVFLHWCTCHEVLLPPPLKDIDSRSNDTLVEFLYTGINFNGFIHQLSPSTLVTTIGRKKHVTWFRWDPVLFTCFVCAQNILDACLFQSWSDFKEHLLRRYDSVKKQSPYGVKLLVDSILKDDDHGGNIRTFMPYGSECIKLIHPNLLAVLPSLMMVVQGSSIFQELELYEYFKNLSSTCDRIMRKMEIQEVRKVTVQQKQKQNKTQSSRSISLTV